MMSFKRAAFLMMAINLSAFAASAAPSYVASLATPAGVTKFVSSDRLWSCDGATCLAGGAATSPARNICVRLAKEHGAVTAFATKGRSFSAEELAACNERAGHTPASAAAR